MRVGQFETVEPVPELESPHVVATVPFWLNAGEAGDMAISSLEQTSQAGYMASLVSPGDFFDFTRYRPNIARREGGIELMLPNISVTYGAINEHNLVFMRVPEPHMNSGPYIESLVDLFKYFNVKRYVFLGSVYDMLPHTRPPLITERTNSPALRSALETVQVASSQYDGPASILEAVNNEAEKLGIETLALVVHLPNYFQYSADYRGQVRLLEAINALYGIPVPEDASQQAEKQAEQMASGAEAFLRARPELRQMLTQLENKYDVTIDGSEQTQLTPEIEEFLQDMSRRFENE